MRTKPRFVIYVVVYLWILTATIPAAGQESAAPKEHAVIRVSSELVLVDALVREKKSGELIAKLEASDFVLSEDHAPQTITYFSQDQLPLSIVLLFDLTQTVRPILGPLAESATAILEHLKPEDQVAVAVFDSHTEVLQDFTRDHSLVGAVIRKAATMKSEDGTFIHEDMYEAIDEALQSKMQRCRRVLVWLTDGTANAQNSMSKKVIGQHAPDVLHNKQQATEKLLRSGVTVAALIDRSSLTDFTVAAMDLSPMALFGAHLGDINKYADETGGPVVHSSTKEAAENLTALLDQIRASYTLGYVPNSTKADQSFHVIRIALAPSLPQKRPELRGKTLVVRTKQGYYR